MPKAEWSLHHNNNDRPIKRRRDGKLFAPTWIRFKVIGYLMNSSEWSICYKTSLPKIGVDARFFLLRLSEKIFSGELHCIALHQFNMVIMGKWNGRAGFSRRYSASGKLLVTRVQYTTCRKESFHVGTLRNTVKSKMSIEMRRRTWSQEVFGPTTWGCVRLIRLPGKMINFIRIIWLDARSSSDTHTDWCYIPPILITIK